MASGGSGTSAGGRAAAAGGTSPATGGGSSLGGGTAQTGGSTSAGGSGSGGAGDLGIASALNTRIEVPCLGAHEGELCSNVMTLPAQTLTFGGDPQKSYKVTLHIRGVTEGHTFTDLNNSPIDTVTPGPYFIDSTQGTPNEDAHAVFWLDVAQPAKKYYINAFYSLDGAFDHQIFALDYLADITVNGGTTVTFNYKDDNTEQAANVNVVAPGVPPAPQAFDGQFVQIDVVSVMQLN